MPSENTVSSDISISSLTLSLQKITESLVLFVSFLFLTRKMPLYFILKCNLKNRSVVIFYSRLTLFIQYNIKKEIRDFVYSYKWHINFILGVKSQGSYWPDICIFYFVQAI